MIHIKQSNFDFIHHLTPTQLALFWLYNNKDFFTPDDMLEFFRAEADPTQWAEWLEEAKQEYEKQQLYCGLTDEDVCYECTGNGDDYYINKDRQLQSSCDNCPNHKKE